MTRGGIDRCQEVSHIMSVLPVPSVHPNKAIIHLLDLLGVSPRKKKDSEGLNNRESFRYIILHHIISTIIISISISIIIITIITIINMCLS